MTMSKLTDFYTHKVSLQEEVKPYDPQREMLEDQLISFYFSFYNLKNSFCGDEKEMLTLWLADKVLDAVGDDELSKDAITIAQEQIQK